MTEESNKTITAADVLQRYREEVLLEFLNLPLNDVNQRGHFGDCPIHIAARRGEALEKQRRSSEWHVAPGGAAKVTRSRGLR